MKKTLLVIAAFITALTLIGFGGDLQKLIFPQPEFAKLHDGKVILYATSWCGYCKKTREFLHEKNIPFFEYDIEKSEEGYQQYREIGGRGVPVLLVNKRVIRGYDPAEILRSLP